VSCLLPVDFGGRRICIIGLPLRLSVRFKAAAERAETELHLVFSDVGSTGYLGLIPHADCAVYELRSYVDQFSDYVEAVVLVLPYAPLPAVLKEELKILEHDFGAAVLRPKGDSDNWPKAVAGKIDNLFLENLFDALVNSYFPQGIPEEPLPSVSFQSLSERQSRFLIPAGAIDQCNQVARHRYKFMRDVVAAIEKILVEGVDELIDAFFKRLGLKHAQTGGIVASLTVRRRTLCLHEGSTETHLKQGDNTTKVSAARVYYYLFNVESANYVGVLYAGPHPDSNVSWTYELSNGA